jgi:pimeloyl-ACP methyl ester carboxylesterase
MIHGYRGNHRGLQAIAADLSKYRVVIPDLPGFGESAPLTVTHSLKAYSDWLRGFLEVLQLENKAHLMGHSFGSLVVGFYATQHSPRSVSLVNPVSSPALEGPRAALTNLTKAYYSLAAALPKAIGQWLLRSKIAVMVMSIVMAKTKERTLRCWIHNQHLSNFSDFATVEVATEGYEASISTDLSKLAATISSPVLVIAATLDDITDIDSQRRVSKLYPNATYREIQRVGHLVHYEAPDQAAGYITEFLDSQP